MISQELLCRHSRDPATRSLGFDLLSIRLQSFIAQILTIFIVVFVFEEAFYGRLALGATPYLLAKTSTEAFLYLFLLLVMYHQLAAGRLLRYQPTLLDFSMAAFLGVAAVSTVMNHGTLVQGAINVRTMLRYMAIYYIVVLSGWVPSERQLIRFIKVLVGIALVQTLLITMQHLAGDAFREAYFAAPKIELVVSGVSKILGAMDTKLGAGYGTFGKTPLAAFYLLFVSVIVAAMALSGRPKNAGRWWLVYVIMLAGIYFTYKRAALLLALTSPILVAWFLGRKRFVKRYLATAVIIAPLSVVLLLSLKSDGYVKEKEVAVSPIESLAQLFSEKYWTVSSTKARGWMILGVGQQALASFKPLGYGADEEHAKAMLATRGGEFSKLVGWGAFDDVYIVAALVYYGPVGVGLLLLAFYFIYRRGRSLVRDIPSRIFQVVGASLSTIVVFMFLAVFVVRLPEFRPFAFLFWANAGIGVTAFRKYGALNTRKSVALVQGGPLNSIQPIMH